MADESVDVINLIRQEGFSWKSDALIVARNFVTIEFALSSELV